MELYSLHLKKYNINSGPNAKRKNNTGGIKKPVHSLN
jgi:hypothetical protein